VTTKASIENALNWLCLAQDVTRSGGFSRAYSLIKGWDLPYPETTGYIVPTFLSMNQHFPDLRLAERAWRAGVWLTEVQFESGAICSRNYQPGNTTPSVFNTGMVLHGWVSLLQQHEDERIRASAARAVDWLIAQQEKDGSWMKNAFNGIAHTYYTMVDWALIRYSFLTNGDDARAVAIRHLDWTLRNQRENGWLDRCWFNTGDAVTTHTISYTTQGLVECGTILKKHDYVEAALRTAAPLRHYFDSAGKIPGTFDEEWKPTASWECCTGNAQTSLVWQALGSATGDESWADAATRLNARMLHYQKVSSKFAGIDGAIPGSWPIQGNYDQFSFPNHAAKFHIDALSNG
jgi:hypothetical protein